MEGERDVVVEIQPRQQDVSYETETESETETENEEEKECSICFEEYSKTDVYRARCGHLLHQKCMMAHAIARFKNMLDFTCPLCRHVECSIHDPAYYVIRREMQNKGMIPEDVVISVEQNEPRVIEYRLPFRSRLLRFQQSCCLCFIFSMWISFLGFVTFAFIYAFLRARK